MDRSDYQSQAKTMFFKKVFCMNANIPREVEALNNVLEDLSIEVLPNEQQKIRDLLTVYLIVEHLKVESVYKISRSCIGGSVGRETNISTSDIDVIVFVNNAEPPFDNVLDHFAEIVRGKNFGRTMQIVKTKFAIHFKSKEFKLDLVPAPNYVLNLAKRKRRIGRIEFQQRSSLDRIMKDPEKNRLIYNSAVAEASVQFMENRVVFANDMARIAKYWYRSLSFNYVQGAKTCIELIAVYAAIKGQRGNKKYNSYLKCFIKFLTMLIRFDELDVTFGMGNALYKSHLPFIDRTTPRVIDPANPYDNLARNWNLNAQHKIQCFAQLTYTRLHDFVERPGQQYDKEYLHSLLFGPHQHIPL